MMKKGEYGKEKEETGWKGELSLTVRNMLSSKQNISRDIATLIPVLLLT